MIPMDQIKTGVQRYVDYDLTPSLPELTQAIIGGVVALYLDRAPEILHKLNEDPKVKILGVMDGDMVDLEALYGAFAPRIQKPITVRLPLIGSMTFDRSEIDKLYSRIRNG